MAFTRTASPLRIMSGQSTRLYKETSFRVSRIHMNMSHRLVSAITGLGLIALVLFILRSSSLFFGSPAGLSGGLDQLQIRKPLAYTTYAEAKYNVPLPAPWAFSYSPYTELGECKTKAEMQRDLGKISGVGCEAVRIFAADCGVLDAAPNDLKIVLGLLPHLGHGSSLDTELLAQSLDSQIKIVSEWNHWDRIEMLVVGSSGVAAREYTKEHLVYMIKYVRKSLAKKGITSVKISTAEPVKSYISDYKYNAPTLQDYLDGIQKGEYPDDDLCGCVDVIGLVTQPFFEGLHFRNCKEALQRDGEMASHVCSSRFVESSSKKQQARAQQPVVVLETGWPLAIAGNTERMQALGMKDILSPIDENGGIIPAVIYSYENETWRGDEQSYFGSFYLFEKYQE